MMATQSDLTMPKRSKTAISPDSIRWIPRTCSPGKLSRTSSPPAKFGLSRTSSPAKLNLSRTGSPYKVNTVSISPPILNDSTTSVRRSKNKRRSQARSYSEGESCTAILPSGRTPSPTGVLVKPGRDMLQEHQSNHTLGSWLRRLFSKETYTTLYRSKSGTEMSTAKRCRSKSPRSRTMSPKASRVTLKGSSPRVSRMDLARRKSGINSIDRLSSMEGNLATVMAASGHVYMKRYKDLINQIGSLEEDIDKERRNVMDDYNLNLKSIVALQNDVHALKKDNESKKNAYINYETVLKDCSDIRRRISDVKHQLEIGNSAKYWEPKLAPGWDLMAAAGSSSAASSTSSRSSIPQEVEVPVPKKIGWFS